MELKRFFSFPCGRTATATVGLLAVTAGAVAVAGPRADATTAAAAVIPFGIVGFIYAVGMASQFFWRETVTMLLAAPPLAFAYFLALMAAPRAGAAIGAVFVLAGLGALWFAAAGFRRLVPRENAAG
jgi:hypothetical protein